MTRVVLSDEALYQYAAIEGKDDFARVTRALRLLESFPAMGHVYDPIYEAPEAPSDVRVVYAGHFGVYYLLCGEEARVVGVCDQRRNPHERFIFTEGRG